MKKIIIFLFLFLSCASAGADEESALAVLISSSIPKIYVRETLKGFRDHLEKYGEKHFLITEYDFENEKQWPDIREKIEALRPDIILTLGSLAAKCARKKIEGIPIVFALVLNPGNKEIPPPGITMDIAPFFKLKKWKEFFPYKKRIGVIYTDKSEREYEQVSSACDRLGLNLVSEKIASYEEFDRALRDIYSSGIDCFFMTADSAMYFPLSIEWLLRKSLEKNFAVIGLSMNYVKAGALISFDCDYEDLGARAAEVVLKVSRGMPPERMDYVYPEKINFYLNVLTAERLRVRIPEEVRRAALMVFGER